MTAFLSLVDRVLGLRGTRPGQRALINAKTGATVTYSGLYGHIAHVRDKLLDLGAKPGDRIALAADRSFAFVFAYLAIHSLGAVAVPLDPRLPQAAIRYIAASARPAFILWPGGSAPGSMDIAEFSGTSSALIETCRLSSEMPADVIFTSGTTGKPKGVVLTHGNLVASILNINSYLGNTGRDIELCPMPLSHSFGLARVRCNLYGGATVILEEGIANPRHLFEALAKYGATGLSMVGPAWVMLRRLSGKRIAGFKGQLRYFELGSAAIAETIKAELASLLPKTHVCMHYGLTEASRAAFLDFHDTPAHLASVGKAAPFCEIKIFSPEGRILEAGASGEICARGGMVCQTYLDPAQNPGAWHGDFFRTGDLGWLDEDGYIYLTGRIKEMINVGGEKVAPAEVEKHLNALPGVREAACVGVPHPVLGERVGAFLVPEAGFEPDLDAIREEIKGKLEPYKVPATWVVLKELPRTVSGKIKRLQLREML